MKNFKKIIAGIIALALTITLLLFANSLMGNPFSKKTASTAAQNYISENYAELNLEIIDTSYSHKFSHYSVFVRSIDSYDTAFTIDVSPNGDILYDDYTWQVENLRSTFTRIDLGLREFGNEFLSENSPYEVTHASFSLSAMTEDEIQENIKKDMSFDIYNSPFKIDANIDIYHEDISYEKMAEVLMSTAKLCEDEGIIISNFSIRIEYDELNETNNKDGTLKNPWIFIFHIPSDILNSENLAEDLKELNTNN